VDSKPKLSGIPVANSHSRTGDLFELITSTPPVLRLTSEEDSIVVCQPLSKNRRV
jgi:hypothetical protein